MKTKTFHVLMKALLRHVDPKDIRPHAHSVYLKQYDKHAELMATDNATAMIVRLNAPLPELPKGEYMMHCHDIAELTKAFKSTSLSLLTFRHETGNYPKLVVSDNHVTFNVRLEVSNYPNLARVMPKGVNLRLVSTCQCFNPHRLSNGALSLAVLVDKGKPITMWFGEGDRSVAVLTIDQSSHEEVNAASVLLMPCRSVDPDGNFEGSFPVLIGELNDETDK